MARCDPKNVAVEWLDAYEAASLNLIVAMHSSDAVIECACGDPKKIHGRKAISDYWRHRLIESPALGLEVLKVDDGVATLSYRTGNEIVEAVLDISSYAGFWVTRRSGGVVCRHADDLDAVVESDTCNHLRQLICAFEPPPGF